MQTSISKKLLAGLLSVVMVLSLFAAVPASNAQAASVSVSGYSKIASGYTYSYKIQNLSSKQYAKVSVSGEATKGTALGETGKSSVKLTRRDGSTVKSTTKINGLSSGLSPVVRVKASNAWGKTFTLTVKVYNKSTNKLVKTVTKTIRVHRKTKDIQLNRDVVALKVGENVTVAAATVPAEYTLPITWTVADETVASVVNGVITAKAEGATTVTVKSGSFTKTVYVVVAKDATSENAKVAKVESTLTNPFTEDYKDAVLLTTGAIIKAHVTDEDGNPVANELVRIGVNNKPGAGAFNSYGELSLDTYTTNAAGDVTFVIGWDDAMVTADLSNKTHAATVNYIVYTANGVTTEGSVSFASVYLEPITNVNTYGDLAEKKALGITTLAPGTNAVTADALATTADMAIERSAISAANPVVYDDDFVASQQVSKAGTAEHAVTMTGGYPVIYYPGMKVVTEDNAKLDNQPVNKSSKEYTVYNNTPYGATDEVSEVLKVDVSKLTYATVNFEGIKLSKYCTLYVETRAMFGTPYETTVDTSSYDGSMNNGKFSYQVPLHRLGAESGDVAVVAYIVAQGQVDTALNAGFTMKDIDYVYKTSSVEEVKTQKVAGAKVDWSIVETKYTAEQDLTKVDTWAYNAQPYAVGAVGVYKKLVHSDLLEAANRPALGTAGTSLISYNANTDVWTWDQGADKIKVSNWYKADGVTPAELYEYVENNQNKQAAKLTVKIPAFPRTGNAIITAYDKNGKVVGYFAIATTNNGFNQNVLDLSENAYAISKDEMNDMIGTLTQDGEYVTINSEKTGRTTLEGIVTINGKELSELGLDAETDHVYTSVQWNPVPKAADAAKSAQAFVAFKGQNIEVKAQLVDVNGNPVKSAGETVTFQYDNGTKTFGTDPLAPTYKATIVKQDNKTNALGQATLTLNSAEIEALLNVSAKVAGNNYDVKVSIKDVLVDLADLYWVDADLAMTDREDGTPKTVKTTEENPFTETKDGGLTIEPTAGEKWEYGVYTTGTFKNVGRLAGSTIAITGLKIATAKTTSSVGEFTEKSNGVVTATSTKAGAQNIATKLDYTSVSADTKVKAYKAGVEVPATFAGVGTTTINKKLTINVTWKADGIKAEFLNILPQANAGAKRVVFFKVTDSFGNVVANERVQFKLNHGTISDDYNNNLNTSVDGVGTTTDGVAFTDAYGIVKCEITRDNTKPTTTITADVKSLEGESFTNTIHWVGAADKAFKVDKSADPQTGLYQVVYDKTAGKITIPMTQDIYAPSVNVRQFTVDYADQNGVNTTWHVSSVDVVGNVLVLNVPKVDNLDAAGTIKVTYAAATTPNGVKYVLTSEDGVTLPDGNLTFTPDGGRTVITVNAGLESIAYADPIAANAAIAADVALVKAEFVKATTVYATPLAGNIIAAAPYTGTNGSTITVAWQDTPNDIFNQTSGVVTVGTAGQTETCTVTVVKTGGTTKTLTFTITTVGTDSFKIELTNEV